jgi:hypothetical protein
VPARDSKARAALLAALEGGPRCQQHQEKTAAFVARREGCTTQHGAEAALLAAGRRHCVCHSKLQRWQRNGRAARQQHEVEAALSAAWL